MVPRLASFCEALTLNVRCAVFLPTAEISTLYEPGAAMFWLNAPSSVVTPVVITLEVSAAL